MALTMGSQRQIEQALRVLKSCDRFFAIAQRQLVQWRTNQIAPRRQSRPSQTVRLGCGDPSLGPALVKPSQNRQALCVAAL